MRVLGELQAYREVSVTSKPSFGWVFYLASWLGCVNEWGRNPPRFHLGLAVTLLITTFTRELETYIYRGLIAVAHTARHLAISRWLMHITNF